MKALALDVVSAIAVFTVATASIAVASRRLPASPMPVSRQLGAPARIAAAVDPNRAGLVLGVVFAVIVAIGTVAVAADVDSRLVRINAEQSPASLYTALLLVWAAVAAFLCREFVAENATTGWLILAIVLAYVGFDEAAELHERIEVRTDLPAPVVLSPVAVLALYGSLRALPALRRHRPALLLFGAGGVAWALSQALDPIHSSYKSVVEEALEMAGSSLLFLALLIVARGLIFESRKGGGEARTPGAGS